MKHYIVTKTVEGDSAAVEYKILGIFTKRKKKRIIKGVHGHEFNIFGDVWWTDIKAVEQAIKKDRIENCGDECWSGYDEH